MPDTEIQDVIVLAQADNSVAQEVIKHLNDPAQSPDKWLIEVDPNGSPVLFYDSRMYIPDDLAVRRRIVTDHHDTMVAGHPGILATAKSVCLSYYWPGLQQFVRNYVDGCAVCQQFKVSTRPTKPSLHPIPSGSH